MNYKLLRLALFTFALTCVASLADAGIVPGSRWKNLDGNVVSYNGHTNAIANQTRSRVRDNYGSSSQADGTPTAGGCSGEADETGSMTSTEEDDQGNQTGNSNTYRVRNGKLQQEKPNGSWATLQKVRGLQPAGQSGGDECGGSSPNTVPPPPGMVGGDTIGGHPAHSRDI